MVHGSIHDNIVQVVLHSNVQVISDCDHKIYYTCIIFGKGHIKTPFFRFGRSLIYALDDRLQRLAFVSAVWHCKQVLRTVSTTVLVDPS